MGSGQLLFLGRGWGVFSKSKMGANFATILGLPLPLSFLSFVCIGTGLKQTASHGMGASATMSVIAQVEALGRNGDMNYLSARLLFNQKPLPHT